MSVLDQIVQSIIKEQELIIGPMAWYEAEKVPGIRIKSRSYADVSVEGEGRSVVDKLVKQYEHLFGRASREVCKEAATPFLKGLSAAEIPLSLQ